MGKMKDSTIPDYDQHSHDPTAGQSSDDDAMTVQKSQFQTSKSYSHDPLCPNAELFNMGPTSICLYCHVIRNTRKDERARALRDVVEAVSAVPDDFGSSAEWDRDYDVDQTGQTRNPRIWVREAVAAIEELGAGR